MNKKLHVKTGDTVVIISGKSKGKKGKVLAVSPKEGKVIVEKCNMVHKHVKPRKMGDQGGIVDAEGGSVSECLTSKMGRGLLSFLHIGHSSGGYQLASTRAKYRTDALIPA